MDCSIGEGILCVLAFLGAQAGLNWMEQASNRDLPWALVFAALIGIIALLLILRKRRTL